MEVKGKEQPVGILRPGPPEAQDRAGRAPCAHRYGPEGQQLQTMAAPTCDTVVPRSRDGASSVGSPRS